MNLEQVISKLGLEKIVYTPENPKEVAGAYTSDLLSDVIANAKKDFIWVTLQTHVNIAAVSVLKELAAIIVVLNKDIDGDTLEKASMEKINILKTGMNAYEVSGKLYEIGIR